MYGENTLDAIVPNSARAFNFQQEYGLTEADVSTVTFILWILKSFIYTSYSFELPCHQIAVLGRCIIMNCNLSVAMYDVSAPLPVIRDDHRTIDFQRLKDVGLKRH